MSREVFITGLGLVTPAGIGVQATWEGLLAGGRFVREVEGIDLDGCATHFAGQVRGFTPLWGTTGIDRVCQFALAAAEEAVTHARFVRLPVDRTVVCVGTSKGGILSFAEVSSWLTPRRHGWNGLPLGEKLADIPPDAPARRVAHRFGVTGGIHATVAACSTGSLSVLRGFQFIRDGQAEVVICGSSDASLHPLWFAAFEQMGVLASAHSKLGCDWSCAPFDVARSGFALGEGAGILVLESGESVRLRRAQPIARIAGAACATDPAGLTQLGPDGDSLRWAIRTALQDAGRKPEDLGCIHAHGTATTANDLTEVRAIRGALGPQAESVPTLSIKGAIGHLLGAAGAVEIAAAAMACRTGTSPGTATLIEPDPELATMMLPRAAFRLDRRSVLKTSLGFGGHVTAVILAPE